MNNTLNNQRERDIIVLLEYMEARLAKIEKHLGLEPEGGFIKRKTESTPIETDEEISEKMEFHIGENWFAKVGIVILAIGIAFLLTFPYKNLPASIPVLIGYSLVIGMVVISRIWKDSFSLLSRYLLGGSLLLFYFTTLRLYYFSTNPLLMNLNIELGLLLIVVSLNLYVSLKRDSVYLCAISLILGYITANIGSPFIISFSGSGQLTTLLAFKELASERAIRDIAQQIVAALMYR